EKGVPGQFIAPLMEDVRQHKPGAIQKLDTIGNSYISEDYLLKRGMQKLADQNTLDKDSAAKSFGKYLDGVVNSGLQSMYTSSGYKNFDEIQARVQWIQAHAESTNPLEVEKLKQTLHLLRDQHEASMTQKLFEPVAKGSGTTN